MTPDLINGLFETFAAIFILNHCRVAWESQQGHGMSLLSTFFFAAWGSWNLFYYPHLGQMFSFYAGLAVMIANLVWIYTVWRIRKQTSPLK